jgi:hypothetical protein
MEEIIIYYIIEMNYSSSQYPLIHGIPTGIEYGQNERIDELNERISLRNIADTTLEPNLDPRPTPTKYSRFPVIDLRKNTNEHIRRIPNYTVNKFNPGSSGPTSGFIANIHTESVLRNQFFSLQKDAGQHAYIPSSTSDLYNVTVETTSRREPQPHPGLFTTMQYSKNENLPFIQNANIGKELLHNHTRTQLRGL